MQSQQSQVSNKGAGSKAYQTPRTRKGEVSIMSPDRPQRQFNPERLDNGDYLHQAP